MNTKETHIKIALDFAKITVDRQERALDVMRTALHAIYTTHSLTEADTCEVAIFALKNADAILKGETK